MAISTIEDKDTVRQRHPVDIFRNLDFSAMRLRKSGRVPSREIIFFADQLSLMLATGTPLNKSINIISTQIRNSELRIILQGIVRDIEDGRLLSEAMNRHPEVFSSVYISMIKAGESGGFLKEMLGQIVSLETKNQEFLSTVRAAMYYPVFLSVFALSVVLFIVVYVFPKFGSMFDEIYDSLPLTTKVLMASSKFLVSYWYFIIIFIALSWYAAVKFISGEKGGMYLDTVRLRMPVIREFFIKLYVSRLMRTLGALVNGNVPLLDSLCISSGVVGNRVFAELIGKISKSVEDGKTISQPVSESPYFPETVKQMISTGEDTGTLDKVMPRLADYYDKDIERTLKRITTIMEPVLLVVMGGVIGVIVISLILPIFRLTRSIH
ncbi:MAG: type II secretion system F family protein [Nitrospirae bacterium]|nr:type II secretion system F family protein [Nitrospirota bacterium]